MMRSYRFWLVVIPLVYFVTLKTHSTYSGDGDEPHYLLIAESLFDDGDLRMENQYPDRHRFIRQLELPGHTIRTPSGSLYPVHDIGLPVLMLPLLLAVHLTVPRIPVRFLQATKMGAAKVTSTLMAYQSMVVTAILSLFLYSLFLKHNVSERQAFFCTLVAILSPPIAAHGYLFFTEIYSAAIVIGMILLLRNERNLKNLILFSLGAFWLSWLHIKNELLVTVLCGLWAYENLSEKDRQRRIPIMLSPAVAFVLALDLRALLHAHYFGRPSLVAAWGGMPLTIRAIPSSFLGLLFDRQFGLFLTNPVFFLLPAGLWLFVTENTSWWLFEGLCSVAYFGGILLFPCWSAAWSPAVRHLLPIIPLLWIPLASVLIKLWNKSNAGRYVVCALVSIAGGLSCCLWQFPKLFWFGTDGNNHWMTFLSRENLHWQRIFPSFFVDASTRTLSIAVMIFVIAALNLAILHRLRAPDRRESAPTG